MEKYQSFEDILSTKKAFVLLVRIPMQPFEKRKKVLEDDGLERKPSRSPLPKISPFDVYFYVKIFVEVSVYVVFGFGLYFHIHCVHIYDRSLSMFE